MHHSESLINSTAAQPLSVYQLNQQARFYLERHFASIWVRAEVSQISRPGSGHLYFSIKDAGSLLNCVWFRQSQNKDADSLQEGMSVLIEGRLSLYEARGQYQLLVNQVLLAGVGELQAIFLARKEALRKEGLFDFVRKPLPKHPKTIAVITSQTGAALKDVTVTLSNRLYVGQMIVYHSRVQGEGSLEDLHAALSRVERENKADVLLFVRGGGAIEDLWSFNEPSLVRAIHACRLPVITGIGHETDTTLCDYVADYRAATPTAAATEACCDGLRLLDQLRQQENRCFRGISQLFKQHHLKLEPLLSRLIHRGQWLLSGQAQALDARLIKMNTLMSSKLTGLYATLNTGLQGFLHASPKHAICLHRASLEYSKQALLSSAQTWLQYLTQFMESKQSYYQALDPKSPLYRGYVWVEDMLTGKRLAKRSQRESAKLRLIFQDGSLDVVASEK
jgi:exodeoxyribonuclease VII large subunit